MRQNTEEQIFSAIAQDDPGRMLMAAQRGSIDLRRESSLGYPMLFACDRGAEACVKTLLDHSVACDPDQLSRSGESCACKAVYRDHGSTLAVLLEAGADPSLRGEFGLNPYLLSIKRNAASCLDVFGNFNTDGAQVSKDGATDLDFAVAHLSQQKARSLAEKKYGPVGDELLRVSKLKLELMKAIDDADLDSVSRLAQSFQSLDWLDGFGRNPLRHACRVSSDDVVSQLLAVGSNPNFPVGSKSPLMEAAYRGSRPIVDSLLDAGADVNAVVEGHEWDAVGFAREGQHKELAKYLKGRRRS